MGGILFEMLENAIIIKCFLPGFKRLAGQIKRTTKV
jgi:hypothetical protein